MIQGACNGDSHLSALLEEFTPKTRQSFAKFIHSIEEATSQFSASPLAHSLRWLIEKIAYKKAIQEEVKSDQMRDFKWLNVQEFVHTLAAFEEQQKSETADSLSLLADFVAQFPLGNCEYAYKNEADLDDKVQLMTFHSAKGLEFLACYLVGIEDHMIPHEKCVGEGGIEEERRLMYVGITRAMKFLTLSMSTKRLKKGKEEIVRPSRFLFDIPQELLVKTRAMP